MRDDSLNLENIFSFDSSGAYENTTQTITSKFKNIYKPSMGKEGVKRYLSLLKFLPNPESISKSIICKRELYLINPLTKQGRTLDLPMLTGGVRSIIFTAYTLCNNSESMRIKNLLKNFSSYTQYFSLVQIIDDSVHPELNGQIKVFKYGDTIHKMILETKNPSSKHKESNNIFDLESGKLFQLNITKNTNNPNQGDYSTCEFLDKTSFPIIDGEECKDPKKLLTLLKESPNLTEHACQEWDANTIKFVADCIYKIFPEDCIELDTLITEFPEIMSSTTSGYAYSENEPPINVKITGKASNPTFEDVTPSKSKQTTKTDDKDDESDALDKFLDDEVEITPIKKKPSKVLEEEDEEEDPPKSKKTISKKVVDEDPFDVDEEKPKSQKKKPSKVEDEEDGFLESLLDDEDKED